LALVAGCESQQNPYASLGEYGFSYDLQQAPVPGLTVAENERIQKTPSASPVLLFTQPAPTAALSSDMQPVAPATAATMATPAPAAAAAPANPQ